MLAALTILSFINSSIKNECEVWYMAKVYFNEDRCKGCKLCTAVCPKKIVIMKNDKINIKGFHPAGVEEKDMGKCIGCAFCATICPDCVIVVEK